MQHLALTVTANIPAIIHNDMKTSVIITPIEKLHNFLIATKKWNMGSLKTKLRQD